MLSSMVRQLASLVRASELTVTVSSLDKWLTLTTSPPGLMLRFQALLSVVRTQLNCLARRPSMTEGCQCLGFIQAQQETCRKGILQQGSCREGTLQGLCLQGTLRRTLLR